MSTTDRDKWQRRYREGAYAERRHPGELIKQHAPDILAQHRTSGTPRALDLACGAGRNALYLARLGFTVDAVDISAEALTRGHDVARVEGLPIHWIERDLDTGLPDTGEDYDLILIMRYLDPALVRAAGARLRPGGYLIGEVHLQTDQDVAGPRTPAFRAEPGALRAAAEGLEIVDYREGVTHDPDGDPVALARLLARRPYGAE